MASCCEYDNEPSGYIKCGDFLESLIRLASQEALFYEVDRKTFSAAHCV